MMFVETPAIAAQAALGTAGAATTSAGLGASAAPLGFVPPQGAEEVSAWLASMIEAHAVQFLPVAALGATQREMFAATGAISAVGYTVSEAARTAMLAL